MMVYLKSPEFLRIIILFGAFILLLIIISYISNKKLEALLTLLKAGAKAEFTTKAGLTSLVTFFAVAGVSIIFIVLSEVRSCFAIIFGIPEKEQGFSLAMAFLAMIITLVSNFIFIGFMHGKET